MLVSDRRHRSQSEMRFPNGRFLAGIVMQLLLCVATSGQAQTSGAASEIGSLEQRYEALLELRQIPPAQRDARQWAALAREAHRALAASRLPEARGRHEEYADYLSALGWTIAESRDPAMIQVLLEFVGISGPATAALGRFGALAIPGLIQIINDGRSRFTDKDGARSALADMLGQGNASISDQNRRQILEVAERELYQHLTFGNVIDVAVLALATGRPDLRAELERLAGDTQPWIRRGLSDRDQIKQCQRSIQVQLQEHDARP